MTRKLLKTYNIQNLALLHLAISRPKPPPIVMVGVVQIAYWAAYLKALKVEEASRIAALVYVYPIFVFPMAYFFLGEALSIGDIFGDLLLVLSGILISFRPGTNICSLIRSPAIEFVFLFWIFYATYLCAQVILLTLSTNGIS